MSNPLSEIISHNTPPTMRSGELYSVSIVVKNIGDQAWSEENQIRLCIFQDGIDYGYRVYLPAGVTIVPGQEYTFVLYNYRAPAGDANYLEYQMLQEGIQYFGEKERVDIVVK